MTVLSQTLISIKPPEYF